MKKVEILYSTSWDGKQIIAEVLEKLEKMMNEDEGVYLLTIEKVETIS